jgi:hypothetical protein
MRRAWVLSILVALAGCADETPPSSNHNDPPPGGGLPGTTPPIGNFTGEAVPPIYLTDCFMAVAMFRWPGDSGPGSAPEGWDASVEGGTIATTDYVEILRCQRLSWGGLERPITLLLESHNNFQGPPTCYGAGTTWILHRLWTDDTVLASAFAAAGVPTIEGSFDFSFTNVSNAAATLTWSWSAAGTGVSELATNVLLTDPQDVPLDQSRRYLVDQGTGIAIIDIEYSATVPTSPEQFVTGMLDPFTLHASTGVTQYFGQADYWFDGTGTGSIRYGDYQCELPASSS